LVTTTIESSDRRTRFHHFSAAQLSLPERPR
jgi:hypothetical protein